MSVSRIRPTCSGQDMALTTEMIARNRAAHQALRTVAGNGIENGTEMLKGYAGAYVLALVAVIGGDATRQWLADVMPAKDSHSPRHDIPVNAEIGTDPSRASFQAPRLTGARGVRSALSTEASVK